MNHNIFEKIYAKYTELMRPKYVYIVTNMSTILKLNQKIFYQEVDAMRYGKEIFIKDAQLGIIISQFCKSNLSEPERSKVSEILCMQESDATRLALLFDEVIVHRLEDGIIIGTPGEFMRVYKEEIN